MQQLAPRTNLAMTIHSQNEPSSLARKTSFLFKRYLFFSKINAGVQTSTPSLLQGGLVWGQIWSPPAQAHQPRAELPPEAKKAFMAMHMAMGQNPNRFAPSEHQPIPTEIGSKMGGEFTCPKMGSQNGSDSTA